MNLSLPANEWVMSHTNMQQSMTWEYVTAHIWMTLWYLGHDSFIYVIWLIDICDMTHSYMWHDSSIYVLTEICHIGVWVMSHRCTVQFGAPVWHDSLLFIWHMWHDSYTCVTWLNHICDMARSYVWHDSLICDLREIRHIGMCNMSHGCTVQLGTPAWHDSLLFTWPMWHDSYTCVTWLIHIRDIAHSHIWHDSSTYVTWLIHVCLGKKCITQAYASCHTGAQSCVRHVTQVYSPCHTCGWVMSHMWMSRVAYVNESCHTGVWVMSHGLCRICGWIMSHM